MCEFAVKFMFFIMSIVVLSLSACHGVSPYLDSGGSSLKGVYDENYVLKLAKVGVSEDLHHFITCPTQVFMDKNNSKLKPEESCVAAIRTSDKKSVTFEIDDIPMVQLALTDREKKAYLARQKEWKEYRRAQEAYKNRVAKDAVIIGAGVGAGASYLGAINWRAPAKVAATQAFKRGKVISMIILGTVLSVAVLKLKVDKNKKQC